MKKFLYGFLILIILCTIICLAPVSYAEDNDEFVPVTYLDTEATFDIPNVWIYEGVIYNKDYSQKKYTNKNNLDVSILYGMRNLKDEIKKKMPFISADSILKSLSEESLINIIGSASNSTIEEKVYGDNKFYEFLKTQKVETTEGTEDINCIVDMMVKGDNIYSFSYVYRDEKEAINDYGKVLTSFKTIGDEQETMVEEEIIEPIENKESSEQKEETIEEIPIEVEKEEQKVEEKPIETENDVKEEPEKAEDISKNNIEEISPSGNDEIVEIEVENDDQIIVEEEQIQKTESEIEFENMGVIQNTYKPKSWIESIVSIIISNPLILISIIAVSIVETLIVKKIKKKRKEKAEISNKE